MKDATGEITEALIQSVAAAMASLSREEREQMAKRLHITVEQLETVIANWRASRQ